MNQTHHTVIIIGAGNAGISTAAQLLRKKKGLDVAIIDPSDKHYYQPAWTLVGGGSFDPEKTVRNQEDVIPRAAKWIKARVEQFEPEVNAIITSRGRFTYEYLVVAPGLQLDWHKVKGLPESLGKNGVTSNYRFDLAPYTYECIRQFEGGTAVFTAPNTPVKCGGAPQKIMYLAADHFRKEKKKASVHFFTGTDVIFAVKEFAATLTTVVKRYGIDANFKYNLIEVRGTDKEAVFEYEDGGVIKHHVVKYDMLHVTPPQSAPDFIKNSPLAVKDNPLGWVDVDKGTFQHVRYGNIFSIGDVANLPTSKTGAAIRKQAPVLVQNLLALLQDKSLNGLPAYDGYTSCPLVTGYGKLVLAEFIYDNKLKPTFPVDQTKERWSMWMLKKHMLPWLYWNKILKGTA
jgi:sulfide:quinone oxidoreductase